MKVLMLNSGISPEGNTGIALAEVARVLGEQGIDSEVYHLPLDPVRDCVSCGRCYKIGRCTFDDDGVNDFVERAGEADGFVFGTPVYYAHPTGRVLSFLDRVFYSAHGQFSYKPAASVVVCRRGGASSSYDVMNKYFGIANMITVGSTYWTMVYGAKTGEVKLDVEGMKTMRNLGRSMAWVLKCIEAGRAAGIAEPEAEGGSYMNFIR